MKATHLVVPLVTLLLAGCDDANEPAQRARSFPDGDAASVPAAPSGPLGASPQKVAKTIDLAAINKTIENFYVQEGRFPKSLAELEDKSYVRALPSPPPGTKFDYDTNSGVVTLEKDTEQQ